MPGLVKVVYLVGIEPRDDLEKGNRKALQCYVFVHNAMHWRDRNF